MSHRRRERRGARGGGRRRIFALERLEDRRLLASSATTFNGPSLNGLIAQAWQGKDTSGAAISTMLSALQSQLTSGPLADLSNGTVDGNGFITEVQSLESSYEQNVDQQLLPHFSNIDQMLKLQGQRVVADLVSLNQRDSLGLLAGSDLATSAGTTINTLTNGPVFSLNTPVSAYVGLTQAFESSLNALIEDLSTSSSTSLTLGDAIATMQAETAAYRVDMDTGLQVMHPYLSSAVDAAVNDLEDSIATVAQGDGSTAAADLTTAINTFDAALLDTTGLFGTQGRVLTTVASRGYVPSNLTVQRDGSMLSSVSGTSSSGGTASLTATLTSASSDQAISGVSVYFTLNGAFAGTAVTDGNGIATLDNVPTSASAGTSTSAVVAYFAGDLQNWSTTGTGDLTVALAATTTALTSDTNPSNVGQTVTFTATVTPATSGSTGVPTGTVAFMDGTTQLGTGTLNASGVATFSNGSLATGTHAITAVYQGDPNFSTSTSTAVSQVVNQVTTTTALTSGTNPSVAGQPVTFTATITPATSGGVTPTGTVSFMDGTTQIGTGTLDSSGTATFTTSALDVSGTPHSITAVYGGDANYATSTSSAVSQVVNQASTTTTLTSDVNPSAPGQTVTFTATVAAASPGAGTPTGTVDFLDNGTQIGTGTLNASGVATFSSSTLTTGTHAITAMYVGDENYTTSTSDAVSQVVNGA
jgi:hypothetical protein